MGTYRGYTVVILIVLLMTCVKNPYLLEYFDAVKIVSKFDVISKNSEPDDGTKKEPGTTNNKMMASKKKNERSQIKGGRQRIVILAGPHKTASTTLQNFFSNLAHKSIKLTKETTKFATEHLRPHISNTDWVFPVGIEEEYTDKNRKTMITGSPLRLARRTEKFYALLASLISGRRLTTYFPEWPHERGEVGNTDEIASYRKKTRDYFRSLLRRPWDDGKNLLIAAEAFDTLVQSLAYQEDEDREGENLHVAADSSLMINLLLDVFPWDVEGKDKDASLSLDDIEVHMNLRTPRISHAISIWHQLGKKDTLRTFFHRENAMVNLYQINTLALALQFVRRGIKVTIVDMTGVKKKEARERAALELSDTTNATTTSPPNKPNYEAVVGGLQGIVGCEILRMDNICDENSTMHLKDFTQRIKNRNVIHEEKSKRNLNKTQLEAIDKILNAYDCGVWQHLQKYQEKGKLRILYPSEPLFESCHPGKDKDISFKTALAQMKEIAVKDNGIPFQHSWETKKPKYVGRKNKLGKRLEYLSNPPK